ncbi:MAG: hypothetical protein OFPII_40700 [Osedax symbiont Rs1]|nr:MAG: hypothetical protein OFPII_40700 [Osedax symbiont Rs1]
MGITGVNEHVEPVFNTVFPSAVVMQRSQKVSLFKALRYITCLA